MKPLNELAKDIYLANKEKGFWLDNPKDRNVGELIALMHSELSEALEAHRTGAKWPADWQHEIVHAALNFDRRGVTSRDDIAPFMDEFETRIKNSFPDELADTIIRVLDFCGAHDIDIESHIELKLAYNKLRPHKHGKLL